MKRLLKISFDLALLSFIPILSWFVLSLIIDKNLINVFSLTYPIQFIYYIIKSIFSTGANISKEKDKNPDAVMSGIAVGIVVAFIVFSLILLNIDYYIEFMNMDINIYREFACYYVVQLFIQLVFAFILNKLYYEDKNSTANKYSVIFNLLNFFVLILSSLIFKNKIIIITITLISIFIFTVIIAIKNFDNFHLKFKFWNFIKYDSVELVSNILFLIIFLFGLSNAMSYGENYALALTFVALITDTQWDAIDAIVITAQIDISKNIFNYYEHRKNAYKLIFIMLSTVLLMFLIFYNFYDLILYITLIYLGFEIINFIIYPIYRLKTCYLQLEYSSTKTTANKFIASSGRTFISFLKTPYCTGLGQVFSSLYQFFSINIMFKRNFIVNKDGIILRRKK